MTSVGSFLNAILRGLASSILVVIALLLAIVFQGKCLMPSIGIDADVQSVFSVDHQEIIQELACWQGLAACHLSVSFLGYKASMLRSDERCYHVNSVR